MAYLLAKFIYAFVFVEYFAKLKKQLLYKVNYIT